MSYFILPQQENGNNLFHCGENRTQCAYVRSTYIAIEYFKLFLDLLYIKYFFIQKIARIRKYQAVTHQFALMLKETQKMSKRNLHQVRPMMPSPNNWLKNWKNLIWIMRLKLLVKNLLLRVCVYLLNTNISTFRWLKS